VERFLIISRTFPETENFNGMAQLFTVHFIRIILNIMNIRPFSISPCTVIIKYVFFKERLLLEYCLIGGKHGAVGWGTVPQDGQFQVRFLVGSLEIFEVNYSFCSHSVALGSMQPLTEMGAKEFPWV
jgi:hypothetical protein